MQDTMNCRTPRAHKRNADSLEDGSFYSSNGPLSPFSPLLRKMRKRTSRNSSGLNEPHVDDDLTLSLCRKVSVVIRVNPAPENVDPQKKQMLCIFPLPSDSNKLKKSSKPRASPVEAMLESVTDTRDMVVVNPKAFGRNIRSEITMETAKTVAQLAKISSEDWARLFHFHQVVWPGSTFALRSLVTAISNDITATASISSRTVIAMGETSSKMKLLFGNVVKKSIAKVIAGSIDRMTKDDILKEFGLLGLTASHVLDRLPAHAVCTLSVVEIGEDDDFYDLLETHPYPRDAAKKVRIHYPESNRGAVLKSLKETPLDSIKTLGNAVRRAYGFAWNKRRKSPPGHILAVVKVHQNASQQDVSRTYTIAQFLDMAVLGNDLATQARRNGRIRRTQSSLGRLLRNALLKEAGNEATLSYRDCTLTKVLQRSIDHPDSKIIVLSTVSPMVEGYEETMGTLRYATRLLHQPGDALLSPFDTTSRATSPTSPATTDRSSPISLDRFDKDHLFVGNLVSDPRQRLAKVMKRYRHKVEVEAKDSGVEAYIPTQYECVEPSEEARDPPAMKETFPSLLDISPINAADTIPTPLAANRRISRMFAEEPEAETFSAPSTVARDDPIANDRRAETSYLLDVMERGSDYDFRQEVPSPLTADTGEVHSTAFPYEESFVLERIADHVRQNNRNVFAATARGAELEKQEVKERWRSRDHAHGSRKTRDDDASPFEEQVSSFPYKATASSCAEVGQLTQSPGAFINNGAHYLKPELAAMEDLGNQDRSRQYDTYDDAIIQPVESHSADDEVKYYVSNRGSDSQSGEGALFNTDGDPALPSWKGQIPQATRQREQWLSSRGASIATDAEEMDELSLELRKRCEMMAESTTLSDGETELDEISTEPMMQDRVRGSNKENDMYHPLEAEEPAGQGIDTKESILQASSRDRDKASKHRNPSQLQVEERSAESHEEYLALVNEDECEDYVDLRSISTSSFQPSGRSKLEKVGHKFEASGSETLKAPYPPSQDGSENDKNADPFDTLGLDLHMIQSPSRKVQQKTASKQSESPNKDKCDLCGDGHSFQELLCNTTPAFMGFSSQKHIDASGRVEDGRALQQALRTMDGGLESHEFTSDINDSKKKDPRISSDHFVEVVSGPVNENDGSDKLMAPSYDVDDGGNRFPVFTSTQEAEGDDFYSSGLKRETESDPLSSMANDKSLLGEVVEPQTTVFAVQNNNNVNKVARASNILKEMRFAQASGREGSSKMHPSTRSNDIAEKVEFPVDFSSKSTRSTDIIQNTAGQDQVGTLEHAGSDTQQWSNSENNSTQSRSYGIGPAGFNPFQQPNVEPLDSRTVLQSRQEPKSERDSEHVALHGSRGSDAHDWSHDSTSRFDRVSNQDSSKPTAVRRVRESDKFAASFSSDFEGPSNETPTLDDQPLKAYRAEKAIGELQSKTFTFGDDGGRDEAPSNWSTTLPQQSLAVRKKYSDLNNELNHERIGTQERAGELSGLPSTPSRQYVTSFKTKDGQPVRIEQNDNADEELPSYLESKSSLDKGMKELRSPRYSGMHSPRRRISGVHEAIDTLKEVLDRGKLSNIGVFEEGYSTLHELHAFCSTQLDKVRKADAEKDAALQEASDAKETLKLRCKDYEDELRKLRDTVTTLEHSLSETEVERDEIHKIASEAIERQGDLERTVAELKRDMETRVNGMVSVEQYNAVEAKVMSLAKEVDDVRAEAQFLESELSDRDMTLSDLQAALRETTDEREAAQQRESQAHTHIESLEAQLDEARKFEFELHRLRKENDQLKSQCEGLENENRRRLEEFRRRLTAKDDYIEELKDEMTRISDEVNNLRKVQQLEESNWKQEMQRHEAEYEELKRQKELAVEENKRARQQLLNQQKKSQGMLNEVQALRDQVEVQTSESAKLSDQLNRTQKEIELKDDQIVRMKSALSHFQEEIRSRVQQVDLRRKEAADLLEKSLEENKSLTVSNQNLQESNDELRKERDDLLRETHMLRTYAYQRDISSYQLNDPQSGTKFEQHSRPAERKLNSVGIEGLHIGDWYGVRKGFRPEIDLPEIRAEDVAAYLAMSAKSTMEQRSADTLQLRQEIYALEDTKDAEIKALKSKIRHLEKRVDLSSRSEVVVRPGRLLDWDAG